MRNKNKQMNFNAVAANVKQLCEEEIFEMLRLHSCFIVENYSDTAAFSQSCVSRHVLHVSHLIDRFLKPLLIPCFRHETIPAT